MRRPSSAYLASVVKGAARHVGLELSRYRPASMRRKELIDKYHIEMVLDVGANRGLYGSELRTSGFTGRIVSFEPLSSAYRALAQRAALDPGWECWQLALGDRTGVAELNIASNFASSSFFLMLDAHARFAPHVTAVGVERVAMRTLDSLRLRLEGPTLMKLDVQGYEPRVLKGAAASLEQVVLIECEMAVEPLYESQLALRDMLNLLHELGFDLVALEPGPPGSAGETAYVDAMLVRTPSDADR